MKPSYRVTESVTEIPKVWSVQSGRPRHNTPSTRAFCVSCVLVRRYTRISVTLEEASSSYIRVSESLKYGSFQRKDETLYQRQK